MSKNKLTLAFFLLFLAVIFLSLRYINIVHQKARIESQLAETKRQIGFLEGQLKEEEELRQKLKEEKVLLVNSLNDAQGKITQLSLGNTQAQEHIFSLIREIKGLEKENLKINEDKARLEDRLCTLEGRNAQMEARLHSIPELKKALKELKNEMRQSHSKFRSGFETKTKSAQEEAGNLMGNLGFIIKNGVSTYRPRIKIEVKPIQ